MLKMRPRTRREGRVWTATQVMLHSQQARSKQCQLGQPRAVLSRLTRFEQLILRGSGITFPKNIDTINDMQAVE